jgi:hypothetical protein
MVLVSQMSDVACERGRSQFFSKNDNLHRISISRASMTALALRTGPPILGASPLKAVGGAQTFSGATSDRPGVPKVHGAHEPMRGCIMENFSCEIADAIVYASAVSVMNDRD